MNVKYLPKHNKTLLELNGINTFLTPEEIDNLTQKLNKSLKLSKHFQTQNVTETFEYSSTFSLPNLINSTTSIGNITYE